MPEVRLSPRRIREHFRRRWPVYLAGIVLLCFLNNLIFTVTRPRIPERTLLHVMLVNVDTPDAELEGLEARLLTAAQAAEPEVRAVELEPLSYLGENDAGSAILLATKFAAGGADLFIADEAGYEAMAARGFCAALDAATLQDAQPDPAALPGAKSDTVAPDTGSAQVMELLFDPETGDPCAVRLNADAILADAKGDICIFVSAGADNPDAALAALQNLATGVN